MKKTFTTVSLDTMLDKHIGVVGTESRDTFENELKIELSGQAVKKERQIILGVNRKD